MAQAKTFTITLFFYLVAVIIACILGELYLSKHNLPDNHIWGWHYTLKANQINQLQFRGQPINYTNEDIVVLLVGDSQVEASGGKFKDMPEKRLQLYLSSLTKRPVKIFTLGAAGYGQDQQLLALQKYFKHYRADIVLLWETPSNDILDNTFPTSMPINGRPKPTFWLDKDGALAGPKLTSYPFRFQSVFFNYFFSPSWDNAWEEKYLPAPNPVTSHYEGEYLTDTLILDREGDLIKHEKSHAGLALTPSSKRIQYGIQLTNKLLSSIKNLATKNNAYFLAFTDRRIDFPLPDGAYKVGTEEDPFYIFLSQEMFWKNLALVNEGLEFLIINVTLQDYRYQNDPHLNDQANDQVMRDLALQLKERIAPLDK